MSKEKIIQKAIASIVDADEDLAMEALNQWNALGLDAVDLITDGYSAGINELGDQFGKGELFLPELIFATEVMKTVTARVEQEMSASGKLLEAKGKILMATVEGDVHDIGKGICCSLLKTAGFDVIDLGREVPADTIIEKAVENDVDIIGTSALLTTTMVVQEQIETKLQEQGLKERFITMVGGAPITQKWADKIGATAYSEDATECCVLAKKLLESKTGVSA